MVMLKFRLKWKKGRNEEKKEKITPIYGTGMNVSPLAKY